MEDPPPKESPSNYSLMLPPSVPKTSDVYVLEKKVWENPENLYTIKDLLSIELSPTSWLKVEISPLETELEENPFMDPNSRMKTLK